MSILVVDSLLGCADFEKKEIGRNIHTRYLLHLRRILLPNSNRADWRNQKPNLILPLHGIRSVGRGKRRLRRAMLRLDMKVLVRVGTMEEKRHRRGSRRE